MSRLAVIIVTHNSQSVIPQAIESLHRQSRPADEIMIVDSGSADPSYLHLYHDHTNTSVVYMENIGFCSANNRGLQALAEDFDYVLFQNPDCFLTPSFLEDSLTLMQNPSNQRVGMLSGLLLGWNLKENCPTGRVDSAGIYDTWYGGWVDRDQGTRLSKDKYIDNFPPALCGALLFCRKQALFDAKITPSEVWNNRFFMYKDDIDLSLRIRKAGWQLLFTPKLVAYHCRGWQVDRKKMPRKARLLSARNELRVNCNHSLRGALYAAAKYAGVAFLDL